MSTNSVFAKIISGEIQVDKVFESERILAFPDINPQAPIHFLVIPKTESYKNVTELAENDPSLLAEIVSVAKKLANDYADGSYRLIFNNGKSAGQTIFHVHAHVLAGGLKEGTLN